MPRAPYNILVLPFLKEAEPKYCVFKRKDMGIWQFIAGGGEDDESPLTAAKRESFEEGGINTQNTFFPLKSMCYVPVSCFSRESQKAWGKDVLVIPAYTFAVELQQDVTMKIADEHLECKWCNYDEARNILHYDLDKTALFELHESLKRELI